MSELEDFYTRISSNIREETLEEEMMRIHSDIAFANAQYSAAYAEFMQAKFHHERTESRMFLTIREQMIVDGEKFTEKILINSAKTHPDYLEARQLFIHADIEEKRLKGICFMLQSKKDMLVSIGMRINVELRGDPLAAANSKREREARDLVGRNG